MIRFFCFKSIKHYLNKEYFLSICTWIKIYNTLRNQYNQYLKEVEGLFFFFMEKKLMFLVAWGEPYAKLISMLSLTESICKDFCFSEIWLRQRWHYDKIKVKHDQHDKTHFEGISSKSLDIEITTGDTFLSEQVTSRLHENVKRWLWSTGVLCS